MDAKSKVQGGPKRKVHGLASYGEDFGIPKPPVYDWINGEQEEYDNRVKEDCKIQQMLWHTQYRELKAIYLTDEKVFEFIQFLQFKMHLQVTQKRNPWKLDVPQCEIYLAETKIKVVGRKGGREVGRQEAGRWCGEGRRKESRKEANVSRLLRQRQLH